MTFVLSSSQDKTTFSLSYGLKLNDKDSEPERLSVRIMLILCFALILM